MRNILLIPRNAAIALLLVYRRAVSPLYGQVCRYYPSCSQYALEAVTRHGVVKGSALAAWRLLRCNPWSKGGVDDVPASRHHSCVVDRHGFVLALTPMEGKARA